MSRKLHDKLDIHELNEFGHLVHARSLLIEPTSSVINPSVSGVFWQNLSLI